MSEILLTNGDINAVINSHGAELRSLNKNGNEYMWNADPAYWNRTSPVLFPFVGAVADGVFRYKGLEYKMGQHGLARDMEFNLIEKSECYCRYMLKSNEETKTKYPLDFELYISYKLQKNGIEVIWEVNNCGCETLEFSIGAHPAFNCILDNTSILINKDGKPVEKFVNSVFGKGLLTNEQRIIELENGIMKLNQHSFDGDAYVIENNQANEVVILNNELEKVLSVKFSSPLVGIWSPPGKNAPFLCIEPWYGRADKEGFSGELNEREWNNSLLPNESFNASYCIEV